MRLTVFGRYALKGRYTARLHEIRIEPQMVLKSQTALKSCSVYMAISLRQLSKPFYCLAQVIAFN